MENTIAEIERRYIGTLIAFPATLDNHAPVQPSMISDVKLGRVLQRVVQLHGDGEPVSLPDLFDSFNTSGEDVPAHLIAGLTDGVVTSAFVDSDSRKIRNEYARRLAERSLSESAEELRGGSSLRDVFPRIAKLETLFENAIEISTAERIRAYLRDQDSRDGDTVGLVPTGHLQNLFRAVDGLQSKRLMLVGAAPNVGKTALLCQTVADTLAGTDDHNVVMVSLDDSSETISDNIIAILAAGQCFPHEPGTDRQARNRDALSTIDRNRLKRRVTDARAAKAKREAVFVLLGWLESGRLQIFDVADVEQTSDIDRAVRRSRKQGACSLLIDGSMNIPVVGSSQIEQSIEIANYLKRTAVKHDVSVLATVELRKRVGTDKKQRDLENPPTLDDLRESAKLAYNSDLVSLLYPVSHEASREEEVCEIVLDIAKNKQSSFRGRLVADLQKSIGRFVDCRGLITAVESGPAQRKGERHADVIS